MNNTDAKALLDRVIGQVFGYQNPLSLDQAMQRFAFDIRLPQQTYDSVTGEPVWVAALSENRFRDMAAVQQEYASGDGLAASRTFSSMPELIEAWNAINTASANRQIGSTGVVESDGVYNSKNVYRSVDIRKSSNILFSDGVDACEYIVAGQTSKKSAYSIRVEDSKNVVGSFNVVWSNKVTNSMFIQDCYDVQDCLFCAHLAGKQFCVANVQLSEEDYRRVKDMVARWTLQS